MLGVNQDNVCSGIWCSNHMQGLQWGFQLKGQVQFGHELVEFQIDGLGKLVCGMDGQG